MDYIDFKGAKLSKIGLGTMGMGGRFERDVSRDEQHLSAIKQHLQLGVNFIDTAEVYANGGSEELVGQAIAGARSEYFIATKVSPENLAYEDVIASCKASLARLKTDYIDLYQVHWPNPEIPLAETLRAMKDLKALGLIRHIGLSNFDLEGVHQCQALLGDEKVAFIQAEYNLFDRSAEQDLIPYCVENGCIFVAYSPLDQGSVVKSAELRSELQNYSDSYGQTNAQIALNFLTRSGHVIVIPKALSDQNIRANCSALNFDLSSEDIQRLESVLVNPVVYIDYGKVKPTKDMVNDLAIKTIEDAEQNLLHHSPSPTQLAEELKTKGKFKAIRVSKHESGDYQYLLEEGKLRFWATVIANKESGIVPVLIRS